MKTVADLKRRIVVGGQGIMLISCSTMGVENVTHKAIGQIRFVVHTQGDSFALGYSRDEPKSRWLWAMWPKRVELAWDEDGEGFTMGPAASDTRFHYRFIPVGAPAAMAKERREALDAFTAEFGKP